MLGQGGPRGIWGMKINETRPDIVYITPLETKELPSKYNQLMQGLPSNLDQYIGCFFKSTFWAAGIREVCSPGNLPAWN